MYRSAPKVALVCLALAVGLSGCLNDPSSGETDGDGSGASDSDSKPGEPGVGGGQDRSVNSNHTLRASGCDYIYLETRTTVDKVAGYLPPGFTFPQPYANTPLVIVDHLVCDRVVIDNETDVPGFAQGRLLIWVSPPDDIAAPDDFFTTLQLQQWVNSQDVLGALVNESVPSAMGTTTWDLTAENPLTAVASGQVSSGEGSEGWRFETLADSERLQETRLQRVYYTGAANEKVAWYDEERQGLANLRDYGGILMPEPNSLVSKLAVNPHLVETINHVGESMDYHVKLGKA